MLIKGQTERLESWFGVEFNSQRPMFTENFIENQKVIQTKFSDVGEK